jgi:hypothetical protein
MSKRDYKAGIRIRRKAVSTDDRKHGTGRSGEQDQEFPSGEEGEKLTLYPLEWIAIQVNHRWIN